MSSLSLRLAVLRGGGYYAPASVPLPTMLSMSCATRNSHPRLGWGQPLRPLSTATTLASTELQAKREERKQRRRSLEQHTNNIPPFKDFLMQSHASLTRRATEVFQMNIGLYCNQTCSHCHVEASPQRKEMMNRAVAEKCLDIISNSKTVKTLDITGGAPELNSQFHFLVTEGRKMGLEVIDRCNLTVLFEEGQENLKDFLAENGVRIVASLPCYSSENVDKQRGKGVFDKSIKALQLLNSYGYGKANTGLILDLVYNPGGAFLPGNQESLEQQYKSFLQSHFGIEFNTLFTLANMPIKRFADYLRRRNELSSYMKLLAESFNPATVPHLMCTNYVSVRWDGSVYDCDFNQQLDLPVMANSSTRRPLSVFDVCCTDDILEQKIRVASHCLGCTAGSGSSCQGAAVKQAAI